ncbi:MAG TPA: TonB-dependent receptor [Lacunisphaera sp.]|nr:TonB-dependent receptor [Lacunisphaera sp.]
MKTTPTLLQAGLIVFLPAGLVAQEVLQLDPFAVTAQKRVQSIGDVPIPLTAYVGSFLEQAGVTDYQGLAPLVPGLFIQEQSPNNPGISLRGITTDSGDPRGEARVSIFQDGVSISRSRASVVELFDLQRVEVLKGPQGTLFGRGAEIGAISLVQHKAVNETSATLSAGYGSFNEYRLSGSYNAPILSDRLFSRIAFTHVKHDGTIDNLADGSDLNGKDTTAVRGTLRWQPTAATTADLIVNWQRDTPPGVAFKSGVIPTSRGDVNPFTAAELNRGRQLGVDRTVWGATGIVEHQFNPAWSMTSTTGWRDYDSHEEFDADGSRLFLLEFAEDAKGDQFSQELRFNFTDGQRFNGFVGASYFDETGTARVPFYTDERQLWPFLNGSFRSGLVSGGLPPALVDFLVPALNPFAPQATLPVTFAGFANPALPPSLQGLSFLAGYPLQGYRADEYTQTARTRALDAFIDGTWQATDRLELTGGLRLTRQRVTSGYEAHNGTPATLGFIVNNIPGYPYLPTAGRRESSASASSWDGRLVGKYNLSKTLNAYASVSRGHRPQSVMVNSTSTTVAGEEVVWNYEVGFKGSLAAGRMQWQASAFQYDYAHFQTNVLSLGSFKVLDAGNATGRGFELGLIGSVDQWASLFANYGYTDATFDATGENGQPQQYAGYRFRLSPRHMFSVGGTFVLHDHDSGRVLFTPVYQYKSAHYFEDNNAAFGGGLRQDGFGVVNVAVTWRSPRDGWEVTARADNLLDEQYLIDAGNVGGSFGIPTFVAGQPRRFGLQVSRRW